MSVEALTETLSETGAVINNGRLAMHEQSLIRNLVDKIHLMAANQGGRLVEARLKLGALAHISADHLREHFENETAGTALEGLRLKIEEQPDIHHPQAQDIILDSLEFEQCDED